MQPPSGCHPHPVQFTNTSSTYDPGIQYFWDFADGSPINNQENPLHVFQNTSTLNTAANFAVRLVVESQYGCRDTVVRNLSSYAVPTASFTFNPIIQTFPDATVSATNTSIASSWNHAWNWGDSSVDTVYNPNDHTYATWGNYIISLVVFSDFCSDTIVRTAIIEPPIPLSQFSGYQSGCAPLSFDIVNESEWGDNFLWDSGNGTSSTQENPGTIVYPAPGEYDITLIIFGPGGSDTSIVASAVTVHPQPIAFFDFGPKTVSIPTQEIQTFNFS